MKPFPVPKNLEVVVSSYGGVGTTMLIKFLSRYIKVNDLADNDKLKHSPIPPISINTKQKFIYIYGDPVYAAISLFRRNIQRIQSIKNQRANHSLNSPIPAGMTLNEYAENGIDKFNFQNHFRNWHESKIQNSILFLRYESLFDNLEILLKFVGLSPTLCKDFPPLKKRNSREIIISAYTMNQLKMMYGNFTEELESVPDTEIHRGKKSGFSEKLSALSLFYTSYNWYAFRSKIHELRNKSKGSLSRWFSISF